MGNQHSHSDHHRKSSESEVDSAGPQGSKKNPSCLTKLFEVIYFDYTISLSQGVFTFTGHSGW